jgi:hypothetical protein
MNYPIPRLTLVISDTISSIVYHRQSIGKHPWHRWGPDAFLVTNSKVSIGDSMSLVPDPNFQIESYRHRLPSVTKCPRVRKKNISNCPQHSHKSTICGCIVGKPRVSICLDNLNSSRQSQLFSTIVSKNFDTTKSRSQF